MQDVEVPPLEAFRDLVGGACEWAPHPLSHFTSHLCVPYTPSQTEVEHAQICRQEPKCRTFLCLQNVFARLCTMASPGGTFIIK